MNEFTESLKKTSALLKEIAELPIKGIIKPMIQNELRINNWVYDTSDATKIDQRVRLDEDYLEVLFAARDYGKLQPIPITEEILMKCGFDKFGQLRLGSTYEKGSVYILITENTISFSISLSGERSIDATLPRPKYLHKLQNVFFEVVESELNVEL